MQQEGDSWVSWRREGVCASDSPIIMGEAPWSSPYQIWLEKTKRSAGSIENFSMTRGKRLEGKVRDRFILSTGIEFIAQTGEWKENRLFRASFDGVNVERRCGLEVKCPGADNFQKIKHTKEIPSYYKIQIEQQLMVGDLELVNFVAYFEDENGENEDEVQIEYRSDPDLRKGIIEAGTHFWNTYVIPDVPPPLTNRDTLNVTDPKLTEDFKLYALLAKDLELREKNLAKIRSSIEKQITHPKVRCGSVSVSKTAKGFTFRLNDKEGS